MGRSVAATCLVRNAFITTMKELLNNFPANTDAFKDLTLFDIRTNISKAKFNSRIQLIHAIGYYMSIPECLDTRFQTYIDELFKAILSSNSHPLLLSAVFNVITYHIPKTNRNRLRVEVHYRALINKIIVQHKENIATSDSHKHATVVFLNALHKLVSTWYVRPSDSTIMFSNKNVEFPVSLAGYASRRKTFLYNLSQSSDTFEALTDDERKEKIQLANLMPYKSLHPFEYKIPLFEPYSRQIPQEYVAELDPESIPTESVAVPLNETLTFRLKNSTIEFQANPQTHKLFLENTSHQDMPFVIQVYPSEYFTAMPAFGIIEKQNSLPILLSIKPQYPGKTQIKGYMYVRSVEGFPLERYNLSGYNLPAIQTSEELNFGVCGINESRTAVLMLTNLLPIDCSAVMVMKPSKYSSFFQVPQSQAVIPARDSKCIVIKGEFPVERTYNETLIICGFGGQLIRVKLRVAVGPQLVILEDKLNFGATDIFFNGISKKINIINRSVDAKLLVMAKATTNEIEFNNGNQLVLKPGEEVAAPVKFLSNISGYRQEKLTLACPTIPPKTISITAFSGPLVKVPVLEDIYFPSILVGQSSFVRIPIVNMSSEAVIITMSVPNGSPIKFVTMPVDYSTRRTGAGEYATKTFTLGDQFGVKLGISAFSSAVIEISFVGVKGGFFQVPLITQLLKPHKADISTHRLLVSVLNEDSLTTALNSTKMLKDFNSKPFMQPITDPEEFKQVESPPSKQKKSEMFHLEPSVLTVFGLNTLARNNDSLEMVYLVNLTNETQRYRLILSYNFKTTVPLEGDIPGSASLEIPIQFDPQTCANPESVTFTAFGSITVLDSNFNDPGMISGQLFGCVGDLVSVDVRDFENRIELPDVHPMEETHKRLIFRNKTNIPIVWESKFDPVEDKSALQQSSGDNSWNPFTTSVKSLTLKPYELAFLDVSFKSSVFGEFSAKLVMSYQDPYHNPNSQKLRGGRLKILPPIKFSCNVGSQDFSVQPEFVHFGHLPVGEASACITQLVNSKSISASVATVAPNGGSTNPVICKVAGKAKQQIELNYIPVVHGYFQQQVMYFTSNSCVSIPFFGYSGNLGVTTNQCALFVNYESEKGPIPEETIINVGNLPAGAELHRSISILNTGTTTLKLVKVSNGNPDMCSLEPSYDCYVGSDQDATEISFNKEYIDRNEVDLDNLNYGLDNQTPTGKIMRNNRASVSYSKRAISSTAKNRQTFALFGVSPAQTAMIKFTNEESTPVNWSIEYVGSRLFPTEKFTDVLRPSSEIRCPVKLFPTNGTLQGGCTQSVEIQMTPKADHAKLLSLLTLATGEYHKQEIILEVIGASSKLVARPLSLDFGVLRVGTQKTQTIRISNVGILQCQYHLECSNNDFIGDPEQEVVNGQDELEVTITYKPKKHGKSRAKLYIHSIGERQVAPIIVSMLGIASYPKLVVLTKVVDFGTALFRSRNTKTIEVQNKGAAEAHIVYTCSHPDIYIESSEDDALYVGPNQTKEITVVYKPLVVERLNAKIYINSSDSRGETYMVALRGNVGIPQLNIYPPDALEHLNFGVIALNKKQSKQFKLVNEGTIFLNYSIKLEEISVVTIDKSLGFKRNISNVPSPIYIEPPEGSLGVGESQVVTVFFEPTMLVEYTYEMTLKYEYQDFTAYISGVGGKSQAKIYGPFTDFDFGLCRLNRLYEKTITIFNYGNLGFQFHVRPEPLDGKWEVYTQEPGFIDEYHPNSSNLSSEWKETLQSDGIIIIPPDGFCAPQEKATFKIQFKPAQAKEIRKLFRFYQQERYQEFNVFGLAASPSLHVLDRHSGQIVKAGVTPDINIGVHPVKCTYKYMLDLVNDGPFGIDYLLQPMGSVEYEIYPLRGFIEAHQTTPISIIFQPTSESKFHSILKVIWEDEPIVANIFGDGGIGRLDVTFLEEKDILLKSLDFGMAPFNSPCKKRFYLMNNGMVGVTTYIMVENEDYAISQLGEIISSQEMDRSKAMGKDIFSTWSNNLKVFLPAGMAIQIGARFLPRSSITSVGDITIRSDSGNFTIPLKGKGGTISLSHRGDLDFGDISCNYTYTRKITIINGGSIASNLSLAWLVVGYASDQPESHISLGENYSFLDPRSQWARQQFFAEKEISDPKQTERRLGAKEYWRLIVLMVRKSEVKETVIPSNIDGPSHTINLAKRTINTTNSSHFKRKQMFYHLISSAVLSSQSSSQVKPFIKITPASTFLPSYGEVTFTVDLNLSSEDTFLATLIMKSDIINTSKYEIALTATPKMVSIFCNDTRMLNFYRQPLGETEVMTRKFTNVGHKDVPYKFINPSSSLTIAPSKGVLKIGQTIEVSFSFKPTDESTHQGDVIFEPTYSHPIRLKMYGGGGYAVASLGRYRRFDFGHCMIGKDTISNLPIVNEGNAILHLTKFELQETDTFFRGKDWPTSRISLFPGKSYNLPLVFNPHEENPSPGNLVIGTNTDIYEIELIGLGREAVLIVSKIALEFSECLIGNSYEQKLGLKNIGDVNYPVTFHLEKEFPDISIVPSNLTIYPFSENFVMIHYSPSHQTKSTIVMTISSPYSVHKVPVMLHSGTAMLEFNSNELDFGMFERTTTPSITLTMRNTGTVKTSFLLKDLLKPPIFSIDPVKGLLHPKKSVDIKISHIRHQVSQFEEKVSIKTDLVDKLYFVKVRGQCEETVLHPDEFSLLNLGVCPVLEPTTKPLYFKNYGKFPLQFQVQSAYPLKVSPTEGVVSGEETGVVYVTWSPSGGYELRTQLLLSTNIGKFQVLVRGKSLFPEVYVSSMYVDFGICALGYSYHHSFYIENRGKVKLHFNIPACKESSYVTSISHGALEPKETVTVNLLFSPRALGKLTGSLIVDCKGIHYKEIVLVGMGGNMVVDILPKVLDLERCPFGLTVYDTIKIRNTGDVNLAVDFSSTVQNQGSCYVVIPDPLYVLARTVASVSVGFLVNAVDRFYAKLTVRTKEQTYLIPVTGIGVKISLSKKSKEILAKENFRILGPLDPYYVEPPYEPLEFAARQLRTIYIKSIELYEQFQMIFAQGFDSLAIEKDPRKLEFQSMKRIFFGNDVNLKGTTREFRRIVSKYDGSTDSMGSRTGRKKTSKSGSLSSAILVSVDESKVPNDMSPDGTLKSYIAQPEKLSANTEFDSSAPQSPEKAEEISDLNSRLHPDNLANPNEKEGELIERTQVETDVLVTELNENLTQKDIPESTDVQDDSEEIIVQIDPAKDSKSSKEQIAEIVITSEDKSVNLVSSTEESVNVGLDSSSPNVAQSSVSLNAHSTNDLADNVSAKGSTPAMANGVAVQMEDTEPELSNTPEGIKRLHEKVKNAYHPFKPIDYPEFRNLANQFMELKTFDQEEETVPEDPVIDEIIQVGRLKIKNMNLEPILEYQQSFDPIDISFLLTRPPPFKKDKEADVKYANFRAGKIM
ncbi:Cilia- and flagella-associated protein 47 [Boothiomyces macroporosus]|uniref:Cilia- and flagella-associated protein 47 n=1 Tax=Boothiomyces macroporosus TaxID=261099 RepID=A0AAD5UBF3_9FUNG|nr:Cilia- and flagella-associated protein 47 [Boothiomyces macroporosus]